MFAGVAGEENRGAFQIVLDADAAQRRAGGELYDTDSLDRALLPARARVKLTTAPLLVL